ncbi:YicC/YloC family endoribonuclease [Planctomycetota bacterium]
MPSSMTGFGRAVGGTDLVRVTVLLKSVNHRGIKVASRLSDSIVAIQPRIEKLVRERIQRGAVQLDVHYRSLEESRAYILNRAQLRGYIDALAELQANMGMEGAPIHVEQVALFPGVIVEAAPDDVGVETLMARVGPVLEQALDSLQDTREREGATIAADLLACRSRIVERVERLRDRIPDALTAHLERSKARVEKLLETMGAELDDQVLARELALFADKTDVGEEIARLEAHLAELARVLETKGPVGQRLEFLGQELLREANTMSAKVQDPDLLAEILEIKVDVGRIKEQVANLQ